MRRIYLLGVTIALAAVVTLLLTLRVSATAWGDSFYVDAPAKKPDVAIDSTGGMHLVWSNPQQDRIQYRHCADASACDAVETLPVLDGGAFEPALALDQQDRPHVVWEQHKGSKNIIWYSRRNNGVWTAPDRVSQGRKSAQTDIAIGSDGVSHIVYESAGANGRGIYHATRGGSSNSLELIEMTSADASGQVASGRNVRVAVDSANRAHVVWNTTGDSTRVKYAYQTSNGTFVNPLVVADRGQARAPDLAIDHKTDRVGIVWETGEDELASFALYRSGVQLFLQTDVTGISELVRHPRLAADCGGRFHIVFSSQQLIQTDWNVHHRVFDPANESFTPTERVTDSTTDDTAPVIATTDFVALAYSVVDTNSVRALRGESGLSCDDSPTPAPTATPTRLPDGWEHIPNQDARITYAGGWKTLDADNASEGNYARCQKGGSCQPNARAELVFNGGSRIEWVTAYANNYGKADVYIDGKAFEVVDLCAPNRNSAKPKFATRTYILSGNARTEHSIRIVAVGHSGCSDVDKNYVAVDGFNIFR